MMIFKALACDYDGTLASEDQLGARKAPLGFIPACEP
jgi:hydroxymethylpyrimidine pyrophosphatase-like HAD family hydrolase